MQYYIGIDGGGTKTNIVLTNNQLEIIDRGSSGPSNFLILGKEQTAGIISELIITVMHRRNIKSPEIISICAGIAGTGRISDRTILEDELKQQLGRKEIFVNLIIDTDARAALEGAHSGRPGCILISGTGSVLFGKQRDGKIFRCGGFGRIIGDEGSGYSIGRKALNFLSKTIDGREPDSELSKILSKGLKIEGDDSLINAVYKNNFDISSASSYVLKAAAANDPSALKILAEESDELLKLVSAGSVKSGSSEFMLSFSGGLLEQDNLYKQTVRSKIKFEYPHIRIKEPDFPPAIGAILFSGIKV